MEGQVEGSDLNIQGKKFQYKRSTAYSRGEKRMNGYEE